MHWFSLAVALLAALGIIFVGMRYMTQPGSMAPSFGLPLPDGGANTEWWLRLKGVRDVTSGVLVLVFLAVDRQRALGLVLLIEAIVPLGDMVTVLAARGRIETALGVHGTTAVLLVLAAIPLLAGAR